MALVETVEKKYGYLIGQFLRFVVVGIINTAINFAVLNLLSFIFHINKGEKVIWITMAAFVVATTNSYFMNKHWAFHDKNSAEGGRKPTLFLVVSIIGLLINSGIVYVITNHVNPMFGISAQLWLNVAAVVATGVSLIWNFIGYKLFVFKN